MLGGVIGRSLRRHPLVAGSLAALALFALAVPVTAYLIVPQFVKSTLHEAAPVSNPAPPQASATPAAGSATPAQSPAVPRTLGSGSFRRLNAVDFGSGRVIILETGGNRVLRFDSVEIAGAPDMYVYLTDTIDGKPGNFKDLGRLRATNGSFNYDLPPGIDLDHTASVLIWCRQFRTTITYAVLEK